MIKRVLVALLLGVITTTKASHQNSDTQKIIKQQQQQQEFSVEVLKLHKLQLIHQTCTQANVFSDDLLCKEIKYCAAYVDLCSAHLNLPYTNNELAEIRQLMNETLKTQDSCVQHLILTRKRQIFVAPLD
jgi:hypothetical protein